MPEIACRVVENLCVNIHGRADICMAEDLHRNSWWNTLSGEESSARMAL
jgi:hypothetical protein